MNPTPGISLIRRGTSSRRPIEELQDAAVPSRFPSPVATIGNWLEASLTTRLQRNQCIASDSQDLTVLFDGYLTRVVGSLQQGDSYADTVLGLYREQGLTCLNRLRGSFVGLVLDYKSNTAHVFNDRWASRPVFYLEVAGGTLMLAPEIRNLTSLSASHEPIDPTALCEFLLFGSYFDDHTLFPSIRKMPPGSIMSIRDSEFSMSRYWRIHYPSVATTATEDDLIEECDAIMRQAVNRLMKVCRAPCIFLSGGLDSRLLFAALLREGHRIPVATYGMDQGDDRQIARSLANKFELELQEYRIEDHYSVPDMQDASLRSDSRAEMIDSPSILSFVDRLSQSYSSYFQGDRSFNSKSVDSVGDVLRKLGMFSLSNSSRLTHWLRPEVRNGIGRDLDERLESMVVQTKQQNLDDIKDVLYAEQRVGNRQNGYVAAKLRSFEQARPWLDEDVVDFFCKVPPSLRRAQTLFKKVYQRHYTLMHDIPLAVRDSIPLPADLARHIRTDEKIQRLLQDQLGTHLDPRLASIVQPKRISDVVNSLAAGQSLPPVSLTWYDRLPGMWRVATQRYENRVHPISLLVRLLQIQLYLRNDDAAQSDLSAHTDNMTPQTRPE